MVQGVSSGFEHRVCRHEDVTPSHHMGTCGRRDVLERGETVLCVSSNPARRRDAHPLETSNISPCHVTGPRQHSGRDEPALLHFWPNTTSPDPQRSTYWCVGSSSPWPSSCVMLHCPHAWRLVALVAAIAPIFLGQTSRNQYILLPLLPVDIPNTRL